ncbi:CRISPR-associated protein Csc2 [Nitrosococcus halophilus Nc 4]|uniref:CRISPR-associated protein Csc2 n=1 Tax=Nitrosococcus halophilus (strain Nc4) TaxID=472759 RepID=D5BYJ8_NITHN|nr:CRISPR-associated protein Csc2 [Nitrosococcus halophilus]ADE15986.1 CRISPR-associated protein Csc2 [Nitrosococcus halophilus Nc 4]
MEQFATHLGSIEHLMDTTRIDSKNTYIHPSLKNLGAVSVVLLREAVAPVVFRNAEAEITDIEIGQDVYVRAVPNKFKYPERGRGLQVLRALGVGGRLPQNKTVLYKGQKPSEAFDLNALVFGDSCNHDNRVLPVKAAVSYSDGLSLLPKHLCVDETFHNRAAEDGTLFDAESKKNSDNLFSRFFIKPGTLMVQVLSTRGKVLPEIGLRHLMLCVGLAGAYGGQTSLTGTNIRTHVVGIYGGRFEQAISSPYELVKVLASQPEDVLRNPTASSETLHGLLAPAHETVMNGAEAQTWVNDLVASFDTDGPLADEYRAAAPKVAELFDNWFGKGK